MQGEHQLREVEGVQGDHQLLEVEAAAVEEVELVFRLLVQREWKLVEVQVEGEEVMSQHLLNRHWEGVMEEALSLC